MIAPRLLLLGSLFLTPAFAAGPTCENITEQIHQDSLQYGSTLVQQQLPWMCLTWLKQKMGTPGRILQVATNQTSLTWHCDSDSDSKITVLTDASGKLTQIDGQYSSERGAGVFSAAINASCPSKKPGAMTTAKVTTKAATQPAPGTLGTATTTVACDAIAEQIYDIAAMSADHPYTHAPFPWEDRTWLEQTFGKPKTHTAATTTYYTWQCQNDQMTTVAYSEVKPGPQQLTTLCKGSNCYLATVSRDKETLHGSLKLIAPKPA